ncbi:MAG: GNAT family N-acetyltransferase [Thiobacillus sp.]
MLTDPPRLRPATKADIDAINGVVERAFMTWNLPDRVKRLSLPSYRYRVLDLDFQHIVVAETPAHGIVGVAAWEPAEPRDLPSGLSGLLLHGLYVEPAHSYRGIGSQLLDAALDAAHSRGYDGLLVKAQADAASFFAARGMRLLPVSDAERDYPHRYWRAVDTGLSAAASARCVRPAS